MGEAFVCFIQCLYTIHVIDTAMLLYCKHVSKVDNYFIKNSSGYTSGAEVSQPNGRQPFTQAVFYQSPAEHLLGSISILFRELNLLFAFHSVSTFMRKIKAKTLITGIKNCTVFIMLLFIF